MNEDLLHFIISSSPLITCVLMILLLADWEHMLNTHHVILGLSLPFLLGIGHVILYRLLTIIPRKWGNLYLRFIIAGTMSAICFLPVYYYLGIFHGFTKQNDVIFLLVLGFVGIHVFLYTLIGTWLRIQIIYGSTQAYEEAIGMLSESRPAVPIKTVPLNSEVPRSMFPSNNSAPPKLLSKSASSATQNTPTTTFPKMSVAPKF